MGAKPEWNPDGKGWREMPAEMVEEYQAKFTSSRASENTFAIAAGLLIKGGAIVWEFVL